MQNTLPYKLLQSFWKSWPACGRKCENFKESIFYNLMVDESTDVSILKQLVLYGRCVVSGELKTCFLKIIDLADGREPTIVDAITTYSVQLLGHYRNFSKRQQLLFRRKSIN